MCGRRCRDRHVLGAQRPGPDRGAGRNGYGGAGRGGCAAHRLRAPPTSAESPVRGRVRARPACSYRGHPGVPGWGGTATRPVVRRCWTDEPYGPAKLARSVPVCRLTGFPDGLNSQSAGTTSSSATTNCAQSIFFFIRLARLAAMSRARFARLGVGAPPLPGQGPESARSLAL